MTTSSERTDDLTGEAARELERYVGLFEKAWEAGQRPALGEHLPADAGLRRVVLREVVQAELEYRLKAGEPARVEDILGRFPELAQDRALVLRLIVTEHELRRRRQSPPALDEFLGRFPQYGAELAARLGPPPKACATTPPRPACPHCRCPIDLPADEGSVVMCPACGSAFTLERASVADRPAAPASRLGKFELLEVVGRGAFGIVYRARDTELDRVVAVKVPRRRTLTSDDEAERFVREARSAAQLRHPGIVAVHDAGQSGETCFVVSEFVPGRTLAEVLRTRPFAPHEAARLTAAVADALQYAHERGVVHRDVKPSNILIGADGAPHLTDFGLARRDAGEVTVTLDGEVLGTPAYMSPEQARGEAHTADGRSDVYSLGAVLYELLTGELPFRGTTRMLLHQVLHDEPKPPRRLNDKVPRDLETICLKALAKEPVRRYATAGGLADDLRRFLNGEPVQARPVGRAEKLGRWCRRNPALAAAAALAALFLLAVAGVSVAFALREHENSVQLGDALRRAERRLAEHDLDRGLALCQDGDVGRGLLWLGRSLQVADRAEADDLQRLIRMNLAGWRRQFVCLRAPLPHQEPITVAVFSPDGKAVLTGSADRTARLWDVTTGQPLGPPLHHQDAVVAVAFSPDGKAALTGSHDKTAQLWEVATGRPLGPPLRHPEKVHAVAFSPDGKMVLTGSGEFLKGPGEARLWDAATGQPLGQPLAHQPPVVVSAVAFHPNGQTFLTVAGATAQLWETATCQPVGQALRHGDFITGAAFSPDGRTLVTGSFDRTARLWEAATGRSLGAPLAHQELVKTVAFSPDGRTVLTGSSDGRAQLWEASSGNKVGVPLLHAPGVTVAAFSPDGKTLLTAGGDVRLWDAATGTPLGVLLADRDGVSTAAFSPDGQTILTGSGGQAHRRAQAHLWEAPRFEPILPHGERVDQVVISPNGRTVLTVGGKQVRLWDAATGKPSGLPLTHQNHVQAAAFSPDGVTVLTGSWDGTARLWDAATGQPRGDPLPHQGWVHPVAFSPDGTRVLTATGNYQTGWGEARLWDVATGKPLGEPMRHDSEVRALAFSPDGKTVLTGSWDRTARLWDAATGLPLGPPFQHKGSVVVAFSPDGQTVLTGSHDRTARLWDVTTGQPRGRPLPHQDVVVAVAFNPDGKTVLTGSHDKTARLWDAATGQPRGSPLQHQGAVSAVAFSPDSILALTGSSDRTARLWEVATGRPVSPPLRHQEGITSVAFHPDGRTILTGSWDRTARLWAVPPPLAGDVERIGLWVQVVTGLVLDDNDAVEVLDAGAWQEQRRRLEELGGPP